MPRRILITDDNRDSVDLLAAVLDDGGWEILGADTVAKAKARIESEQFDLVILESWLPDGDGADFCRELRSSWPDLPILFLSAAAFPDDINDAKEAGCSGYLVKPCNVQELSYQVRRLVSLNSPSVLSR